MSAPVIHRLALGAASAAVTCALAAAPATALPAPGPAVRAEIGPGPAVGQVRAEEDLVPVSRVVADLPGASTNGGQAPLLAAGTGVVALVGAFVVGLSRRPEPAD